MHQKLNERVVDLDPRETAEWVEALAMPAIMDTSRAEQELGWRPRWSALDAWRDTLA